jgi:mannose-6-phosphate isomerase
MTQTDTSSPIGDTTALVTAFWRDTFPHWRAQVIDGPHGVFDVLDVTGKPDLDAGKTLLAQARTLFTFAHIAQITREPAMIDATRAQAAFVDLFRRADGLYRAKLARDGAVTGDPQDEVARSYELSFVLLGLVTWNQIETSAETEALIEACWAALQTHLTDPDTGVLRNDDTKTVSNPAQNPHMHWYEACLQAYRMTRDGKWLTRAADIRTIGLRYFFDTDSGSLAEFITPDYRPLPAPDGLRREIGHQCEWAWLLSEEAHLAGRTDLTATINALMGFAEQGGFAAQGPLKGAAYDAVSVSGAVMENRFLLWPQTEAIKAFAARHMAGDPVAEGRAKALLVVMFAGWFDGRPAFVNQLDAQGETIWPEALTRVMYHIAVALTEGARAGFWPNPPAHPA